MTAEIGIMNRSGIALAADSAVTISFPQSGGKFRSSKIFSANKLFMLSKYEPVGIMIYGNASLMGIPWELLIKEYRKKDLGQRIFDRLEDYGESFIAYLNGNPFYFPHSLQADQVTSIFAQQLDDIWIETHRTIDDLMAQDKVKNESSFNRALMRVFTQVADARSSVLSGLKDIDTFQIDESGFQIKYEDPIQEVIDRIRKVYFPSRRTFPSALREILKKIAYLGVRKNTFSFNPDTSGIVIAGYGQKEIYPTLAAYEIEGVVDDKLKYVTTHTCSINEKNGAYIAPFAQGDMVKTFMDGVSPGYEEIVDTYLENMLAEYPRAIADKLSGLINATQRASLEQQLKDKGKEFFKEFKKQTNHWTRINNSSPVLDAVNALPIDELASMAEALVNLTSFKRRVTPVLETVGGPIDVAVITKGDGFVWIQRKQYFDSSKNPHFLTNYYKGDG